MTHTPTPYQADGFGWIAKANGEKVSGAEVLDKLNAHDELVAALTDALPLIERAATEEARANLAPNGQEKRTARAELLKRARAALAKVQPAKVPA